MPDLGAPEILIIVAVILLLFGATKLPTFARSLGRSMRIFKSEVKGIQHDDEPAAESGTKSRARAEPPQQLAAPAETPASDTPTTETPAAEAPADERTAREPVAEKQ
ncbi:MAG: Sec-independent protein translocase subunit TatA [Streptosporangiales bacterium]|nr:Sec-independent protein translocase subunit TatA [Streptosporangiales bacterium]